MTTTLELTQLAPHLHKITTRKDGRLALAVWFSYETPIALMTGTMGRPIVRCNEWGPTTGRHLNVIDSGNKVDRLDSAAFDVAMSVAMASL